MARVRATALACLVGAMVATACSSGSATQPATSPASSPASVATAPGRSPATAPGTHEPGTPSPVSPSDGRADPTATASTGVPGIDDPDPLCRGWSGVQATLHVLQVASAFGGLRPQQLARIELLAAPTVVVDADLVDRSWPTEPASEHDAALATYVEPLAARARVGMDALAAAGVTEADLAALRGAWHGALATYDPDDGPVVAPAVDPALSAMVDRAVASFAGGVMPLADDRSLDVSPAAAAKVPATRSYVVAHCADLSSVGFGDTA